MNVPDLALVHLDVTTEEGDSNWKTLNSKKHNHTMNNIMHSSFIHTYMYVLLRMYVLYSMHALLIYIGVLLYIRIVAGET